MRRAPGPAFPPGGLVSHSPQPGTAGAAAPPRPVRPGRCTPVCVGTRKSRAAHPPLNTPTGAELSGECVGHREGGGGRRREINTKSYGDSLGLWHGLRRGAERASLEEACCPTERGAAASQTDYRSPVSPGARPPWGPSLRGRKGPAPQALSCRPGSAHVHAWASCPGREAGWPSQGLWVPEPEAPSVVPARVRPAPCRPSTAAP